MATWKRFFNSPVSTPGKSPNSGSGGDAVGLSKFTSGLKEIFTGPSNRLERYNQFDQLDRDPVVHSALNIIAEFCTQENIHTKLPFYFEFQESTNDSETAVLRGNLNKWAKTNNFRQRMFYIMRNTLKYGDVFFVRDPETYEWFYVDPRNVEKVTVDDSKGKQIYSYHIRNVSLNLSQKIFTHDTENTKAAYTGMMPNTLMGRKSPGTLQSQHNVSLSESVEIMAEHVIHLSLNSSGMDYINWPFSSSILESIFKPAKQKELLENAFLIYTIQRAPERRVFYVYTGDQPPHKAMEFVERFKYELHQKRIPTRDGGGNSIIDGTYDPQCLSMDTKIPLLDGRMKTLHDLTNDFTKGVQNWTYSIDPKTGEIFPGKISWAGVTRKNAKVIQLTLDNGKELILTPDHKIPVWGKGYVEAKNIVENEDSLYSFDTREKSMSKKNRSTYTQVFDHSEKKFKFVHRIVAEFMKKCQNENVFVFGDDQEDKPKNTIHHFDYNSKNNNPENLHYMNFYDHLNFHTSNSFWNNKTEEEANEIKKNISSSLVSYFESEEYNNSDHKKKSIEHIKSVFENYGIDFYREEIKKAHAKFIEMLNTDPVFKSVWASKISESNKGHKNNQEIVVTDKYFEYIKEATLKNNFVMKNTLITLSESCDFKTEFKYANLPQHGKVSNINYDSITAKRLRNIIRMKGYSSWNEFCIHLGKEETAPRKKSYRKDTHNQPINYTFKQLQIIHNELINGKEKLIDLVETLKSNKEYIKTFEEDNKKDDKYSVYTINTKNVSTSRVLETLQYFGYSGWKDFKEKSNNFNHKVVSVKYLEDTMDTGCITIDQDEEYHNHHNFAVDAGIFVKNSMTEDFFVPINSEGQGPRIETLPGGDAMANGTDQLKFFNNLITRGLNIPSSYIPTEGEDSPLTYNDGKTGMALLQEWRFAQHCKRLQSMVRDVFDSEFKRYCKKRGTIINNGDFTLEFEEPQSFGEYRQMEKDATQLNVLQTANSIGYFSKRFLLKRFGGLSDEELKENERLWKEENRSKVKGTVADIEDIHDLEDIDLNNVGVKKPSGEEDEDLEGAGEENDFE